MCFFFVFLIIARSSTMMLLLLFLASCAACSTDPNCTIGYSNFFMVNWPPSPNAFYRDIPYSRRFPCVSVDYYTLYHDPAWVPMPIYSDCHTAGNTVLMAREWVLSMNESCCTWETVEKTEVFGAKKTAEAAKVAQMCCGDDPKITALVIVGVLLALSLATTCALGSYMVTHIVPSAVTSVA